MTFQEYDDYPPEKRTLGVFFGGPNDGKPVELKAGWPRPDVIGNTAWGDDGYVWNTEHTRFEWKINGLRRSQS